MNQAVADREGLLPNSVLERRQLALAICGFSLAYLLAMKISIRLSFADALLSTLATIVPLVFLGLTTRHVVRRHVISRSSMVQFASHMGLGAAFALAWYWALMVLLGLQAGRSWTSFQVRPIFNNPAIAWMLLQGLTFYALVVTLAHLESYRKRSTNAGEGAQNLPATSRYFIKGADAILPIDAREIVTIRGAGDYAEVTTERGRHLARRTLTDFEMILKSERFIRVHRAAIVNLERVAQAEPAGDGRMLIHMDNGEMIHSSRAGARLLRAHVI